MLRSVRFEPIHKENWREVLRLKLEEPQTRFVAPNYYSIIEAMYEGYEARAIYDGDVLVGFVMYVFNTATHDGHIIRLMVHHPLQGQGYGRAALHLLIEMARQNPAINRLLISFVPENTQAERLYSSVGFADTGELDDGERVFAMNTASKD